MEGPLKTGTFAKGLQCRGRTGLSGHSDKCPKGWVHEKYINHDSILRIEEKTKNFPSFGFTHVIPWEINALNSK